MSVMGTGVAAGVAQTALQAQQVSRQRDSRTREQERPAQRVRDTYQTHLKVLEEHDEGENAPRLRVDDQNQERRPPHPEQQPEETPADDEEKTDPGAEAKPAAPAAGAYGPPPPNASTLDVRA